MVSRTLVGCVGYTNLRDLSFGPHLLGELRRLAWPDGVEVDDLGPGGPIAAVHRLRDAPCDRVVLAAAVARGREPGELRASVWDGVVASEDLVQAAVAEGVTGVISLDNLVTVGGYFAVWPCDLVLLELEPVETAWGPELSPAVARRLPFAVETVRALVHGEITGLPRIGVRPASAAGISGRQATRVRTRGNAGDHEHTQT